MKTTMKRIVCALLTVAAIGMIALPERKADAQVIVYSTACCDGYGYVRCTFYPPVPVGNSCFCYGQGYGVVCL